jgi:hypothetical protein
MPRAPGTDPAASPCVHWLLVLVRTMLCRCGAAQTTSSAMLLVCGARSAMGSCQGRPGAPLVCQGSWQGPSLGPLTEPDPVGYGSSVVCGDIRGEWEGRGQGECRRVAPPLSRRLDSARPAVQILDLSQTGEDEALGGSSSPPTRQAPRWRVPVRYAHGIWRRAVGAGQLRQ